MLHRGSNWSHNSCIKDQDRFFFVLPFLRSRHLQALSHQRSLKRQNVGSVQKHLGKCQFKFKKMIKKIYKEAGVAEIGTVFCVLF